MDKLLLLVTVVLLNTVILQTEESSVTSIPEKFKDQIFKKSAKWKKLSDGHAGSEGPQFVLEKGEQVLYYAAHHDLIAYRWTEKGGLKIWRDDSPEATSFRPDGKGNFYVVEQATRRLTLWDKSGKEIKVLADKYKGKLLNRPNDARVKSDGTVWFTDPDNLFKKRPEEKKELPGNYVFKYDPKKDTLEAVIMDLVKPNGIVFSPDEKWLYITDSPEKKLYRFPISKKNKIGEKEIFFGGKKNRGMDGISFDHKGRLWVTGMADVTVLDSKGETLGSFQTRW